MSTKKKPEMVVEVIESAGEMDAEVTPSMLPDEPVSVVPEVIVPAAAKAELIVVSPAVARTPPIHVTNFARRLGSRAVVDDSVEVLPGEGESWRIVAVYQGIGREVHGPGAQVICDELNTECVLSSRVRWEEERGLIEFVIRS